MRRLNEAHIQAALALLPLLDRQVQRAQFVGLLLGGGAEPEAKRDTDDGVALGEALVAAGLASYCPGGCGRWTTSDWTCRVPSMPDGIECCGRWPCIDRLGAAPGGQS